MSELNLKLFENDLMIRKNQLIERVDLLNRDKKRKFGALPQNFDDQAIVQENDEVIDGLDKLERVELQDINLALTRIKKGTFGKCISCGSEIQTKRLKAVPYASTCIRCIDD